MNISAILLAGNIPSFLRLNRCVTIFRVINMQDFSFPRNAHVETHMRNMEQRPRVTVICHALETLVKSVELVPGIVFTQQVS